jgi:hypothetical protein
MNGSIYSPGGADGAAAGGVAGASIAWSSIGHRQGESITEPTQPHTSGRPRIG